MPEHPPETYEHSCGVVPIRLVAGEPVFLLLGHHRGHWGFPKGHPVAGEGPLTTALRELGEEAGLSGADVHVFRGERFLESYTAKKKGRWIRKSVVYYPALVGAAAVSVQAAEVFAHAWLSAAAARERMTFEESRGVLDAVVRRLPRLLEEASPPARFFHVSADFSTT